MPTEQKQSILTRLTAVFDRVKDLTGEGLEPEEMLAFMLGYMDGENERPSKWGQAWYKQGFKHGRLGDGIPGVRPDDES